MSPLAQGRTCLEISVMIVANVLRVLRHVVDAVARSNQIKAERMMTQHLARAGRSAT